MHVSATDLKNHLGQYLTASITEPVIVEKSGKPSAVVISYNEFQRFQAMEDHVLGIEALQAEQDGYLGTEKSMQIVQSLMQRIKDGTQKD